jgi:hypothetical protein
VTGASGYADAVFEREPRAIAGGLLALSLAVYACGSAPPAAAPAGPGPSGSAAAPQSTLPDRRVVKLPGSRVRLGLPQGFCRPTRQLALVSGDGVALVLIEGNLSSQKLASEWFAGLGDEMKRWAQGPVEVSEIKRPGAVGTLSRMSGAAGKTMVLDLAGENGAFATVIATYDPRVEKTADAVVSGVELDARAPLDPFALLGLHVADTAGFDLAPGPVPPVVLRENAAQTTSLGAATYSVAVLPLPSPPRATPADALRDVLAAQIAMHSVDLKPEAVSMTMIDGMPAAEATADEPGQDGARIYAAAAMDRGAIVMVKGRVSRTRASLVDRFQRMTRSIHRVPEAFGSLACK